MHKKEYVIGKLKYAPTEGWCSAVPIEFEEKLEKLNAKVKTKDFYTELIHVIEYSEYEQVLRDKDRYYNKVIETEYKLNKAIEALEEISEATDMGGYEKVQAAYWAEDALKEINDGKKRS